MEIQTSGRRSPLFTRSYPPALNRQAAVLLDATRRRDCPSVGCSMPAYVDPTDVAQAVAVAVGVSEGHIVGAKPGERPALRWRTPDGAVRWMSGTGIPQTDALGQMTGVVVTLRDVTELVAARLDADAYAHQWQVTVCIMLGTFAVLEAVRHDA